MPQNEPEGMTEAQEFLNVLPEEMRQKARDFINVWGFKIQGDAMRVAPVGVSGDLKNDVQFQITESEGFVEGQLGFNVFYAKYVHGVLVDNKWVGPKRHFVPFRIAPSLERWARVKGFNVDNMFGMWVGGKDKARPFLYEAAMARQGDMIAAFRLLGGTD